MSGKSESCVRLRFLDRMRDEPNSELRRVLHMLRDLVEFSVSFTVSPEETDVLETMVIREWLPDATRNTP